MFIADFHIHSKYSRATSPKTDLEHLSEFAKIKGIDILATGDFTHPEWLKEIKDKLEPAEQGLYKLKAANEPTRFILSSEISCIYSKAGSVRKVHIVVLAPSIEIVEKINIELAKIGNLKADGRPILGLDAKKLAEIVLNVSQDCLIIPAHVMTPWFGVFGSKSGFDSLEECFEDYTKYIYAMETGLSADPAMLWRLPDGRRTTLISNSDAHCVHPDTNIYSSSGRPETIENFNPSKVLSINFTNNLKQAKADVSKLHKLPSPSILYKIVTRSKDIITTSEHRFFVLENEKIKEKSASELKKNDLVACLRQVSNKGKSKKLIFFTIDHQIKILSKGIDYLKILRMKNGKTQKDVGKYVGVGEGCIWTFEKYKIKTPKESFINKYCEFLGIDKSKFKKKFMIYRFPSEKFPEFTDENFCQILGYILGDGGIERSKGKIQCISLTDKDLNLLTYYKNLIKKVFDIESRVKKKKGNANAFRFPAYLAEYFQKIDSKILLPSVRRQMPEFIFSLPKTEIGAFLRGLFDAEGTIAHHSIQISSASLILIKEVQALLLKFGINSNIYFDFEKNKKKWRYKISIYGQEQLKIFIKEIGFNSIPKKEKLSKYLFSLQQTSKNSFADPLPLKEEILKVKKVLGVSCYDIPKRLYYHLEHNNTLKRNNVREFMEIFLKCPQANSILGKIKKFVESDIIWESVQTVRKIKSNCKFVYDLTIPNYENYVANGFITHNSPGKLGREANVFEGKDISYNALSSAIKVGGAGGDPRSDQLKLAYTIEFFPQEGKYHFDGHRECNVSLSPEESKKYNNLCPSCGKPMTIGVMNRIDKLADKPEGFKPKDAVPFKCLVPLLEIIGEALDVGPASKRVAIQYNNLIEKVGTEFHILLDAKQEDMAKASTPEIAEGIIRVRQGRVNVEPGYDGVFGKVRIFSKIEKKNFIKQKVLF